MKLYSLLPLLLMPAFCHAEDSVGTAGQALFAQHCELCHRAGGTGTYTLAQRLGSELSLLEERTQLSADYVQTVVRWGIGSMPRFSRAEVTDAELKRIADYLSTDSR